MDQIRIALNWLKAQHFWVLSGIATIIAIACWYVAAGELAKQFKENKGKIDSEFSAQRSRQQQPFHPNPVVNSAQEEEIKELSQKVGQVWASLYQRQRDEVLKWPEQLDRGSRSFTNHVKGKSFGDFIANSYADIYLNYIQNRFSDLPKIIDALEADEQSGSGRSSRGLSGMDAEMGGMGAMAPDGELAEEQDFLVLWQDQLELKQQLAWNSRPSPLKIWVTQEDLWVYETLLKAIAATNKAAGADRHSNAAVRIIYEMQVGSKAAQSQRTATRIFRPESEGAALGGMGDGMGMEGGMGMGMGMDGGMGMDSPMMEGGMGMGRMMEGDLGMGAESGGDAMLLMNRYVDENDQPLPAPPEGSPLDFGQEYKRLPVKLTLNMDQRWLPRLIVELANAPLQIEVQEVRINPAENESGGSMGGGMRSKKLRALELASRTSSRGGFAGGAGMDIEAFPREPQVGDVILRGTVFLFNPPDEAALASGDAGESDAGVGGDF